MSTEAPLHMQPPAELEPGPTPEALFYVLPYLGVRELLTLEAVSSQLREGIRGDATLWQDLHVDAPLNRKLTDGELRRLARRAEGRLHSLALVHCTRVSESVVHEIVAANPLLQKLNLSGCTGVNVEALLGTVQLQADRHAAGLTQLRIGGLYNVTPEILSSLETTMRGPHRSTTPHGPQYYKHGEPSPCIPSDRPLDLEACPKCQQPALVFDCTRPTCAQRRSNPLQQCRGCYHCVMRCDECGVCVDGVDGDDFGETFCMEVLCEACWLGLPKCSDCNRSGCRRHLEEMGVDGTTVFTCQSFKGEMRDCFSCESCQGGRPFKFIRC